MMEGLSQDCILHVVVIIFLPVVKNKVVGRRLIDIYIIWVILYKISLF